MFTASFLWRLKSLSATSQYYSNSVCQFYIFFSFNISWMHKLYFTIKYFNKIGRIDNLIKIRVVLWNLNDISSMFFKHNWRPSQYLMWVFGFRLLSGKCQPGWTLLDSTCYMYHGGPMTFAQAKDFCAKVRSHDSLNMMASLTQMQLVDALLHFIIA